MNKDSAIIIFALLFTLALAVGAYLYIYKYEITVPQISVSFVSPDDSKYEIEYVVCYRGTDLLTASIASHKIDICSAVATATTGQKVKIPQKKITSFWPGASYNSFYVDARFKEKQRKVCYYQANLYLAWIGSSSSEIKASNNDYLANDLTKTYDIKCLTSPKKGIAVFQ